MDPRILAQQIETLQAQLDALKRAFTEHQHTGLDSKTVDLTDQIESQGALTPSNNGIVDGTYDGTEAAVLSNVRTRVNEIEDALQAFGILS